MRTQTRDADNTVYMGLRQNALGARPQDIGVALDDDTHVYGAVVDMAIGDHMATLACFEDLTTSIYFENGGGMLGLGQRYEAVAKVNLEFLSSAGKVLRLLPIASDFDLPPKHHHNIYLLAEKGVYKAQLSIEAFDTCPEEVRFLFYLYQKVLDTVREHTQRT